jgi:hypothetical protein
MAARREPSRASTSPLDSLFLSDRRDRHPGTHFADELGALRPRAATRARKDEPRVDEDLGCSEFGIDFPALRRS